MTNMVLAKTEQLFTSPSKLQLVILEIAMLLPCFVAWHVLRWSNDGIITLLSFFVILAAVPLLYCYVFNKDVRQMIISGPGLQNKDAQIKEGLMACVGIIAMMMGAYYAYWHMDVKNQAFILNLNIPLKRDLATTAIFFMIFSFINPVLEEFFWRVFLAKTLKNGELYNFLVTFHYALYHIFVVQYITQDWILSFLAFGGIFGLGRFLVHLKDRNGLIVGTIAHLGADMGVALAYCHVFTHYIRTA